jgi:inorganic pyrophosphatase
MEVSKSETVAKLALFVLHHGRPFGDRSGAATVIFEVFVEAPKGGRIDDESHSFAIGRRLPSGARYPADYGFMPWTLADDQNPLDVVIITDEPSFRAASCGVAPSPSYG